MQFHWCLVTVLIFYCGQDCIGQPEYHDLIESIVFILENHFNGSCLSFIKFDLNLNVFEVDLLKRLHDIQPFYILSAVNGTLTLPYPCFYLAVIENANSFQVLNPNGITKFYVANDSTVSKYMTVSRSRLSVQEIRESLTTLFVRGHPDAIILNPEDYIKVYTLFPFGIQLSSCPENGILMKTMDQWINGSFHIDLFPRKHPEKFNKCYLNVSFKEYIPYTVVMDGSKVSGIDGEVVKLVGKGLNMTVNWIQRDEVFIPPSTGIIADVLFGRSDIACGGLRTIPIISPFLHSTRTYTTSYLTWYLPHPPEQPMWRTLYVAFTPALLAYTLFTVLFTPLFITFIAKYTRNELSYFKSIIKCYLASWALAVGNSTGVRPKSLSTRILYTAWLIWTIHVASAYLASLTGLITKNAHIHRVDSFEHLKSIGLKTGLSPIERYNTLSITDPIIRSILDNYRLINNSDDGLEMIIKYKNMSLLDNSYNIDYKICTKPGRPLVFNSRLTTFPLQTGLMIKRSHYLYDYLDRIIVRLIETGLTNLIIDQTTKCRKTRRKLRTPKFKPSNLKGLSGVFIILAIGHSVAVLAFFIELYVYKRNNRKKICQQNFAGNRIRFLK